MRKAMFFVFAILSFLFVSCVQEAGTATMRILLYQEEKTLSVSESAFDITKYTVTGSGPGGSAFTADTTSSSLVLEGLQTGSWSLTAKAYNSKGKVVAGGEANTVLSADSSNVSLPVVRVSGTGKLVLTFKWDDSVLNPMVRVTLTRADGTVYGVYDSSFASYSSTSGTFKQTALQSGFYVLSAELFSGSTRVTGAVEALQISGTETTEGTISFCSKDDYSSSLSELYIARTGDSPVRGQLSRNQTDLASGEEQRVSLVLSGSSLTDSETYVRWYMDGIQRPERGLDMSFVPTTGWHIVNAVVVCPNEGLTGSLGWKFNSRPEGASGTVVLNGEVNPSSSNPVCNSSSLVGAVGDDRYIVICPELGLLQVVKVYNSTLMVEKVYKDTDEGFSWLGLSECLYSSCGMDEFAVTDSGKNINLLYLKNGEVRPCTKDAQEIRFTGYVPAFSEEIESLDVGWIDSSNSIIGFACFKEAFLVLSFEDGVLVKQGRYLIPRNEKSVIMASSFGSLVVCANAEGVYYSCSFRDGRFYGVWKASGISTVYRDPIMLLSSSSVAEAGEGFLSLWVPGTSRWICKSTSDVSPLSLGRSADGKYLYASDSSGKLTTYSISDSGMRKISILDASAGFFSLVVGKHEILARKASGEMVLFSIAGGK